MSGVKARQRSLAGLVPAEQSVVLFYDEQGVTTKGGIVNEGSKQAARRSRSLR